VLVVNYSPTLGGTGTLPMTAGAIAVYQSLWLGIAIMVVGATLVTVAKLFPRVAIEPVQEHGRYRLGLTVNGRPVRRPAWVARRP
jgi:hypothetical protein